MELRNQLAKAGICVRDLPTSSVSLAIDEIQRQTSLPKKTVIRTALSMLESEANMNRISLEV